MGGFTLIEIMVSVSIFSMVMIIVMGSILSVINANQKSQTLRSVMDNMSSTLEDMTRTIRFGHNYHCGASDGQTTRDCAGGDSTISVTASNGSEVTYHLVSVGTSAGIARSIDGGTDYLVTSPDVTVTNLVFRVFGSTPYVGGSGVCDVFHPSNDCLQPKVVMVVSGHVGVKATTESDFTIQTTVSQRTLDFQ